MQSRERHTGDKIMGFGFEIAQGLLPVGAIGSFGFEPTLPGLSGFTWLVVPLLVIAAVLYLRIYRADARHLTPRQRRLLWALRSAVTILVLVMLLKPSFRFIRHEERLPVVAMLVDESTSMNFPSAYTDPLLQSQPKTERSRFHGAVEAVDILQQELSLRQRVKVLQFSDTTRAAGDIPTRGKKDAALSKDKLRSFLTIPAGDYTEGGDAVIGLLERLAGEKISGIVLLSDGRNTGGEKWETAADRAAQAGVPVHSLAFGSEDPLRDLGIDRVSAPGEASLGDILELQVEISNYIQPDLKTEVTLFEEGQVDQRKTVVLQKGSNRVRLTTIPRTEGLREYRVEVPRVEDEVNYDNNQAAVHVKVVRKALRVLFVAGKPTREYEHVVLCLLRDPVIRVSCFLQSANVDYVQQGHVVIDRLPRTNEEWRDYDVVILYDVDPKPLSSQQVSGLEYTVNKGAGLVFVAGRNYGLGQMLQIHANKMREMLPVDIDKNRANDHERILREPWKVERTPEAKYHAICRLAADEAFNEEIWSTFPELYWRYPVQRVKSQAVAILKAAPDKEAADLGDCLMAIQRFGEGVTIYLGTDEIWRWRYPYGAHDYDLFWTHIIRYLGETRLHGVQKQVALGTDKLVYAPGERVQVRLQILDHALLQQLQGETVAATVVDSMKAKHVIPLEKDAGNRPLYQGTFLSRYIGPHAVQANHHLSTADSEARDLFDVQGSFSVERRSLEAVDTRADLDGLRKLAEKTGGKYMDYRSMSREALQSLAREIPAEKLSIPHETVREVWDTWTILLLVLALLSAEWALRKYWGLL